MEAPMPVVLAEPAPHALRLTAPGPAAAPPPVVVADVEIVPGDKAVVWVPEAPPPDVLI